MSDKSDDEQLFRAEMADVRPIASDRQPPQRPRPPAKARFSRADNAEVLRESLTGTQPADAFEEVAFARPGVSRAVLRKLRRGQYSIADELDLHGMTVAIARQALDDFLLDCKTHRKTCVRVIHGKGTRSGHKGPVLKPKVARWLQQRDAVLAFVTARPADGGSGALYVLLR